VGSVAELCALCTYGQFSFKSIIKQEKKTKKNYIYMYSGGLLYEFKGGLGILQMLM
jgi:hypothetical protein